MYFKKFKKILSSLKLLKNNMQPTKKSKNEKKATRINRKSY